MNTLSDIFCLIKNTVDCNKECEFVINEIDFIIKVSKNRYTTNIFNIRLYANKNTHDFQCNRASYKITCYDGYYSFHIDLVNPNEFCQNTNGSSPSITGRLVVCFGILMAIYFDVTELTLYDEARIMGFDDDNKLIRQKNYVKECQKNYNVLEENRHYDYFSYYRQFGFIDHEIIKNNNYINKNSCVPRNCLDDEYFYHVIANSYYSFKMILYLNLDCLNEPHVQCILNSCIVSFFRSNNTTLKEIVQLLKQYAVLNIDKEECKEIDENPIKKRKI